MQECTTGSVAVKSVFFTHLGIDFFKRPKSSEVPSYLFHMRTACLQEDVGLKYRDGILTKKKE